MSDLEDQIKEVAENPKKVAGDSGSVEEHSIDDLIKADKYLASKEAGRLGRGFRISKIVAPGA